MDKGLAGIGHNSGLVDEPGRAWRKFVWAKARKSLLPTLPVEVVRLRVKRAAQLGLPYKTYAGIRASTGHDLIGFLFSSNALRIMRDGQGLPDDRAKQLNNLQNAVAISAAHRPVTPAYLAGLPQLSDAGMAPVFSSTWAQMRDDIRDLLVETRHAPDRFVIIGDTAFEAEWAEAARTAGFLPSDQYFRTG